MAVIDEPEWKGTDMSNEPVRLSGYTALAVGLALLAIIGWSAGMTVEQVVLQVATVALTSIGGLEFARNRVSPYEPEPDGFELPDDR